MSFIVQLPLANSSRMDSVRNLLRQRSRVVHVSTFDDRPGKLFEGLEHCRSAIFLASASGSGNSSAIYTAKYQRWPTAARANLFPQLEYARLVGEPIFPSHFPKYASSTEESLFRKVKSVESRALGTFVVRPTSNHFIFYQEATQYWVKACVGLPYYAKNGVVGPPAHGRYLYFRSEDAVHAACAVLNSSLFYAYFIAYGDCFHLSDGLTNGFPITTSLLGDSNLSTLCRDLMADLKKNAIETTIQTRDGNTISYAEYYASRSKPIIDEIDRVLAKHYGFTDEELDFIINYDIKYRMGRDAETDDA